MPRPDYCPARPICLISDATPDLAGADIDVSRFIRESDDTDVQAFWRDWPGDAPPSDMSGPAREELSSVPLGDMRSFCRKRDCRG